VAHGALASMICSPLPLVPSSAGQRLSRRHGSKFNLGVSKMAQVFREKSL
jgi:hypothetical protein